jgi:hypothetical protein
MRAVVLRPVVLAVGIPLILAVGSGTAFLIYFQNHKPPAPLGLGSPVGPVSGSPQSPSLLDPCKRPAPVSGSEIWLVVPGSQAGYRVHELFIDVGLHEAVARTNHVNGYAVVHQQSGSAVVTSACFSVEAIFLASIDTLPPPLPAATGRDKHIPDLLDTANHPFVVFQPAPFTLSATAFSGPVTTSRVLGKLSMRGRSLDATADLTGKVVGETATVGGTMVVHVPDWGMEVPGDPAVQPDVTIEFAIQMSKA